MRLVETMLLRNTLTDLQRAATRLAERQRELASGRRIHVASDDPYGAAAAVRARGEIGTLDRYVKTADSVEARLSIVDNVLSDLVSQITAAKVAAASVRRSDVSDTQREAAALQLERIRDAILSDVTTSVQGRYLFSGSMTTTVPYQQLPGGAISAYQGDANAVSVDIDRTSTAQVTFSGETLLKGTDATDLFTELDSLISAIRAGDQVGVETGMAALDRAFNRAAQLQLQVGSTLQAVGVGRLNLAARRQAQTEEVSRHEDANLVETVSELAAAENAYRAALGALSRPAQLSLLDFLR